MKRIALLDVNVLVAIFDPDHVHHDVAHRWFEAQRTHGWATCPIVENGVVRILSNARLVNPPVSAVDALDRLAEFCEGDGHEFWPDDFSLRELRSASGHGLTHGQVTDVYLLGLAFRHGGRLATFDQSIPIAAVDGATDRHLEVIPA